MLKLTNIKKDYMLGGGDSVTALKNVNLEFRKSEFVSILGPSGCGKTTLLNIIGGLDRYTEGDIEIDGISTKHYSDVDWDAYRNIRIGFIFQSYNLISHIDILANVEMALLLAGVKKHERKARAIAALEAVGLGDHIHKKPNQLSGGQMQRVSIARALINNPSIILADEPTGALDSATSVQIMELLKEISANKLIIMVTHNPELAEKYSNRIVKLKDGEIVSDSNPYHGQIEKKTDAEDSDSETETEIAALSDENAKQEVTCDTEEMQAISPDQKAKNKADFIKHKSKKHRKMMLKKTSMSFWSAIKLSFTNLMTKKGRTFMTAFAGSIGIIGVALVLAISNGFSTYVNNMQKTMLSGYPVTVTSSSMNISSILEMGTGGSDRPKFPVDDEVYSQNIISVFADMIHTNNISEEYIAYLDEKNKSWEEKGYIDSLYYNYGYNYTVYNKNGQNVGKTFDINNIGGSLSGEIGDFLNSINWQEMVGDKEFMLNNFDVIGGKYPESANEVVLIVDATNTITSTFFNALGFTYGESGVLVPSSIAFDKILGNEEKGIEPAKFYIPTNDQRYKKIHNETGQDYYTEKSFEELGGTTEGMREVTIVGILRQKETSAYAPMMAGVAYTQELTQEILEESKNSEIVKYQISNPDYSSLTGEKFESSGIDIGDIDDIGSLESIMAFLQADSTYNSVMHSIGGSDLPGSISFYASNFDGKDVILADLDAWNETNPENEIKYLDSAAIIIGMLNQIIKIITIALVCFSSVSLVVSSIMIGIITYVSVVERTKEIGILRSLGARKRDVSNVFNAETVIIGFTAGLIGVIVTYILSIPINLIIANLDAVKNLSVAITSIAMLNPLHAILLVGLSVVLTVIAGLVPARIAAKRDPVVALRSE